MREGRRSPRSRGVQTATPRSTQAGWHISSGRGVHDNVKPLDTRPHNVSGDRGTRRQCQRGTGAGTGRQRARDRDPRTLDFTQGPTTAVLVNTGASRGTAQAWTEPFFLFHYFHRPIEQYGRDMVEECRLTVRYHAQKQSSDSCNTERPWAQRLSGSHAGYNWLTESSVGCELGRKGAERAYRQLTTRGSSVVQRSDRLERVSLWMTR